MRGTCDIDGALITKTDTPLDVHVGRGFSDIQNIDAFLSDMSTVGYSLFCNSGINSGIDQMQTGGFICCVPMVVIG